MSDDPLDEEAWEYSPSSFQYPPPGCPDVSPLLIPLVMVWLAIVFGIGGW